jgi:hypothetical protein
MRNLVLLACLLFAAPTLAAEVQKPAELQPVIKASAPIGQGAMTKLWFKGYDAALWTDAPKWSMDSLYALSLKYGMGFTTEELTERSIEEIERTKKLSADQKSNYSAQLAKLFPNVKKNDVITALYEPSKGTTFFYNGKKTGSITDPVFAKDFMGIWLAPGTSAPELRTALLGSHDG